MNHALLTWNHRLVRRVRRCRVYLLVLFGIFLMSCSALFDEQRGQHAFPENGYREYEGWGFTMHLPEHIEVNSRVCVDFLAYEFLAPSARHHDRMLSAYAGNHPNFPTTASTDARKTSGRIHGLNATFIRWNDETNMCFGDVLIELPVVRYKETGYILPAYLHFFYGGLDEAGKNIVEQMIMSVKACDMSETIH